MDTVKIAGIIAWLVDGARSAQRSDEVLTELCDQLVACGLPLWRASVFVRTLHPEFLGRQFRWMAEKGTEISAAPFRRQGDPDFRQSPVVRIYDTGAPIRRRLVEGEGCDEFPILEEFRRQGATDYYAAPLHFTNGEIHVATFTSRRAEGFTQADLAALESIVAPLARVAEVRALRRTAINLLDAYLGHRVGERILSGQIRRGETEAIGAAIWFSDMRGFTEFSDGARPHDVTDLLNQYFDCQAPAIEAQGGEVLKFIGDGLFAIFRTSDDPDAEATCRRALAVARQVRTAIDELSRRRVARSESPVRFALALHLGEVLYGNVGGGARLDFTCIGPAVNHAARLEGLAKRVGRQILCSSAFAKHVPHEALPIGEFELKGIRTREVAYGLRDEVVEGTI